MTISIFIPIVGVVVFLFGYLLLKLDDISDEKKTAQDALQRLGMAICLDCKASTKGDDGLTCRSCSGLGYVRKQAK